MFMDTDNSSCVIPTGLFLCLQERENEWNSAVCDLNSTAHFLRVLFPVLLSSVF